MTCRDFELLWQERLDRPGWRALEIVRAQDEHATVCPACHAQGLRYQILLGTLAARVDANRAPSPGFADRVLAEFAAEPSRRWVPAFRPAVLARLAVAASVLLGLIWLIQHRFGPRTPDAPASGVELAAVEMPERPLTEALADVTSATLVLARQTSEPAARLGFSALNASQETEEDHADAPHEPTSALLHRLGESVGEGIRPLGGSARRAFGFLLGPASAPETPPHKG